MSLLRDIQTAAIDHQHPLPSLLRKCVVLAARLGSHELGAWANRELEGYTLTDNIPDYRYVRALVSGNLVNGRGDTLENTLLPIIDLPDSVREDLTNKPITEGVAELQSLVDATTGSEIRNTLMKEYALLISAHLPQGVNVVRAYQSISKHAIVGVLDIVRSRIVNFSIAIERDNPNAGEAEIGTPIISPDKVHERVATIIFANQRHAELGESK